ncbi:MAG: SAM-dependent methyltransferase [Pseudomonadota bacterium]
MGNRLKDRLIRQIRLDGPIPMSLFMQICLHDPVDGYYATRPGLGSDFTTAPELSQTFGELIGAWVAHEWQSMGKPAPFALIEYGPGRARLMSDALRILNHTPAGEALRLHLVEASPALRAVQTETLAHASPVFLDGPERLPDMPTMIVANEFLDCLPARQFAHDGDHWRERLVGLGREGTLTLGLDANDALTAPHDLNASPSTTLAEVQPGLNTLVDALAAHSKRGTLMRVLLVDYGTMDTAPSDTLRAYKAGKQVDPFAAPGEADLTVDVDFGRLKRLAMTAGLSVAGPVPQGAFLGALGLQTRLDRLIRAAPDKADDLFVGAQRLVAPSEMGERFKAICLSSPGLPDPAGFPARAG